MTIPRGTGIMKKVLRIICALIVATIAIHFVYPLFLKSKTIKLEFVNSKTVKLEFHQNGSTRNHIAHDQEVDFRIIVMTFNRAEALKRCLESLNGIDFLGDKVHVDIWIDRSKKDGTIHNQTFIAGSNFKFQHGTVKVNKHQKHVGLYGQWLSTWSPREDTREIALLVEDDITLSKHVYRWLKMVHKKYDSLPYINGFSTQGKSIKHGTGSGSLHGPETEVVFSYPVLGSWGFSPKVQNWLHFLSWFDEAHTDPKFQPSVPGMVVTSWYQAEVRRGRTDSMWTIWHIYHAYKNHELTIYPNFPGKKGLAINWEEPGLHYHGHSKAVNKDPIVVDWDPRYEDLPTEPIQLDANGKVVKQATRN